MSYIIYYLCLLCALLKRGISTECNRFLSIYIFDMYGNLIYLYLCSYVILFMIMLLLNRLKDNENKKGNCQMLLTWTSKQQQWVVSGKPNANNWDFLLQKQCHLSREIYVIHGDTITCDCKQLWSKSLKKEFSYFIHTWTGENVI